MSRTFLHLEQNMNTKAAQTISNRTKYLPPTPQQCLTWSRSGNIFFEGENMGARRDKVFLILLKKINFWFYILNFLVKIYLAFKQLTYSWYGFQKILESKGVQTAAKFKTPFAKLLLLLLLLLSPSLYKVFRIIYSTWNKPYVQGI
jgi:hypothetical protein